MNGAIRDLRFSVRLLAKNPGFSLIAICTLALGIGANTAIFSVVNAVLLRPLPYKDAERIAVIQEINEAGKRVQVTPANFVDWRNQNTVFENLAAIFTRQSNLVEGDSAERINLAMTSANFFDVFELQPEAGRLFIPSDEQAGHEPIVVLSFGLWQRRFGASREIVGRNITLDGKPYSVVGIAPRGFHYPDQTDVWIPPFKLVPTLSETMDVERARGFGFLSTVAKLKPGLTLAQAKAEMETITSRLRERYPDTNNRRFDRVETLHGHLVGDTSRLLWLLLGAVTFVLMIACSNVANLMLVRATSRQKEVAIRTALGAARSRIVRQLLTESAMLGLIGGAAGLLLGLWGVDLLPKLLPSDFPRLPEIGLDFRALLFTFGVSLLCGIIFGIAPAWQVSHVDVHEALKENSRGTIGGRSRLRNALVVIEVALSLLLMVGAGLLFRSFLALQTVDSGFNSTHVLTMRLNPSGTNFRTEPQYIEYYKQVEERVRQVSGVESVGLINTLPLSKGPTFGFQVEGRPVLTPDKWPGANYRNVSADYFYALDIPILDGRNFDDRDNLNSPFVAIINKAAADQYFSGEEPVGKRITFGGTDRSGQPVWTQIIGVAGSVRSLELQEEPTPDVYTPTLQDAFEGMSLVVRTSGEPGAVTAAVREAAQDVDRTQPITNAKTMETIVNESVSQPRFNFILLAAFGVIALLLSASGIYGVMAYTVSQRTYEIGIRMALGERPGSVFRGIIGRAFVLSLVGVALGAAGAFVLTRLMSSFLFGVSPTDLTTFVATSLLLTIVALGASFVPARRATRVDPMVALRYE